MPFGLCNALATFQRCMLAIFHDMIEESVEVFMDYFFVFENSFDNCLNNLDKMLQRCKDANLVLNWEKCHFMVKEGIVLGHKVSGAGLEVEKAKIDVMRKLPPLLMLKALEEFNDECHKAFDSLKEILTCTPVIMSPNWNLLFELMCDVNDSTIEALLVRKARIKWSSNPYLSREILTTLVIVNGILSHWSWLKIGFGVTDVFGYAVTMMWQVYGITNVFGYGVTDVVMA
uniref:Retrovirus-related Pol polyprotein from transposon 17.6 n=1 Tax=Tanacetum cinerariifolium TaxID=118510 RepID=A0A699GJT5_TANCI|nr:retrovirus-related Pol polyprotein from transposon 17.6 [Tanacetum cinerariifolium]